VLKFLEAFNLIILLPLLQLFFEGVQAKVAQGVKESEVSYQMAFSKQELRKVIKEYPAREVKKGLESLYKKVEKHLSEEENLLQASLAFLCFRK
jgi:exocyst complex component 1